MPKNVTVHWHGVEYAAYFLTCSSGMILMSTQTSGYPVVRWCAWIITNPNQPWGSLCVQVQGFPCRDLLVTKPLTLASLLLVLIGSRYHSHSRLSLLDGLYGALFIR